ncbi:MAG: pullulanase-type alpha-1,6-glucosidase [Wenzhouxiangellaceae bacterium]
MHRLTHYRRLGAVVLGLLATVAGAQVNQPDNVTLAGSLQEELGCSGDWQPDCLATQLLLDEDDQVWQQSFNVPAGDWEYKAPINLSWDENYGANAIANGPNIGLSVATTQAIKFYYSHETHWITDNLNSTIAVAAGSFQSELGCASDWDPACLRSWLQDPDGDGVFRFVTELLPAGSYEVKVALSESWDVNFGEGGVQNGANIAFDILADCGATEFVYDSVTNLLTIGPAPPPAQPFAVTVAGSLQEELGCSGDWQPDCAVTGLGFDDEDRVWQGVFGVPAGDWEYKAPLNLSWDENYGLNATLNGPNIPLSLADPGDVKFYFDRQTNWITDNINAVIATAPGSFQSELGCAGDWDPSCLRSWLQDADGDGLYTLAARLPAGDYEVKVAHNESWDVNFGEGGVQNGANIGFSVAQSCRLTFFSYDPDTHLLNIGSEPGGPRGDLRQSRAHWIDRDTIAWNGGGVDDLFQLHIDPAADLSLSENGVEGGLALTLVVDPAGLSAAQRQRFPHLASYRALKLIDNDVAMLRDALKGQLAVSAVDSNGAPVDATGVQLPGVLDDLFVYDGELGVSYAGNRPTIRVWAPTAQDVSLLLFADSDPATTASTLPMTLDPDSGVWSITGARDWDRQFYQFEVSVYAPSTRAIETNRVTDPYSFSLSANSARSQIVDLGDRSLKPRHWDRLDKPGLQAPEDIVLYELHVRDFSIRDASVPEIDRGRFTAFTHSLSAGMQHLAGLADAGVSHVHLLPVFDLATVTERRQDQLSVDEALLASYPPDSDQQQAAIFAIRDQDGFNWGYDPWHYTVPDGSYATDPDGVGRIVEFRQMVQALNETGLRVVMDVVYNHTTASGQNARSVLDRIVPGYYHRLNDAGGVESSTCCDNTASEHRMMEKLLIDSVLTWALDYKVDGFRFDLMGHHSKANMLKLRAALDQLNPRDHGIDGRQIYLYGEGWNFGEVANNARFEQATQVNMAGTGIGTFSDRLRDGARGGNPFSDLRDQGFINGLGYDQSDFENAQGDGIAELLAVSDWLRIGMAGDLAAYQFENAQGNVVRADQVDYFGQQAGYTADPQENITYVAAHDNETLFDANQVKLPAAVSMADRVRVQTLSNAIVLLGQGIPFIHAGQEFLRSKSMDRDSFNSGDWFNAIDWTMMTSNWGNGLPVAEKNQDNWPLMAPLLADPALAPTVQHRLDSIARFKELVRIRQSSRLFRLRSGEQIQRLQRYHNTGPSQLPGLIVASVTDTTGEVDRGLRRLVTLVNARADDISFGADALAGDEWLLHPELTQSNDPLVRQASYDVASGAFSVPARTVAVFIEQRPAAAQIDLLIADIEQLHIDGDLSESRARNLNNLLTLAQQQLAAGRPQVSRIVLGVVSSVVRLYGRLGILPRMTAEQLNEHLTTVLASL